MSEKYLLCYYRNKLKVTEGYVDNCICGAYYDELPDDIAVYNNEIEAAINEARYTGRINIFRVDELLEESHIATINKDQEYLIEVLLIGLAVEYPESTIYTERELHYAFNHTEL